MNLPVILAAGYPKAGGGDKKHPYLRELGSAIRSGEKVLLSFDIARRPIEKIRKDFFNTLSDI